MKKVLILLILLRAVAVCGQDSTGKLTISGYAEIYYQYDLNRPPGNDRPGFMYSHNRHNEFNANLAFVKAAYTASIVRANIAWGFGTYMNANYAGEPAGFRNLLEANAGIRLGKKELWLDAGVFASHIGFESAISKDCWNLTRSILADNSPYFESGAKLTYTSDNGKWLLSGLVLNGWQRIKRLNGNSLLSWGTQIQFKPSDKVLLNSSTFIGTDKPDSARLNRLFHNFYGTFSVTDKFGLTVGFDMGTEEKTPGSSKSNTWYSPVLIAKYSLSKKWIIAARGEYYSDRNGVIIARHSPDGFKTSGFSVNVDHQPARNVLVRLEWRRLQSKDAIFDTHSGVSNSTTFITSSIAVSF